MRGTSFRRSPFRSSFEQVPRYPDDSISESLSLPAAPIEGGVRTRRDSNPDLGLSRDLFYPIELRALSCGSIVANARCQLYGTLSSLRQFYSYAPQTRRLPRLITPSFLFGLGHLTL
jgi:hypothetical protein